MGSYKFTWQHPSDEVWVTGTFDNWSKSTRLDKVGSSYEKTVALPNSSKILYKFVADGEWKYDHTAQTETDHEGNVNNVLYPHDIQSSSPDAVEPTISSVAPGATTLAMAGVQPLEPSSSPPGAFPASPPANDDQTFSVNPIPASAGLGNPDPSSVNNNTIESTVHDDPELKSKGLNQTVGVAPIPATGGAGNPVHLQPGEKVPDPSQLTGNTVDSTVKLDKESYERSDAGAPVVAPASSSQATTGVADAAILGGLGPQTTNMIPESSMPQGKDTPADITGQDTGPTISSVAPGSTTAALAGQVPKEPRGDDKDQSSMAAKVAAGAAAVGVGAAGAAVAANELLKDKAGVDAKSKLSESVQQTIDENANAQATTTSASSTDATARETAAAVPAEVTESQKAAAEPAEAAANPEAVKEKSEVEKELLSEVKTTDAKGEPAPTMTAATATSGPTPTTTTTATTLPLAYTGEAATAEAMAAAATTTAATSTAAATTTTTSEAPAGPSPPQLSASGAPQIGHPTGGGLEPLSMESKNALNATKDSAATPATDDRVDRLAAAPNAPDSRDVSPMSKPTTNEQNQPAVTTGIKSGWTTADSPSTPESKKRNSIADRLRGTNNESKNTGTPDSKKEKRRSFFGKIKDKLKA